MDHFAIYGTQFEALEDEQGAISKKPTPIHEQVATDEKGRKRFHGAFTGGFSAGYFNTVGTKHGWVPQTFTSSRASRAEHTERMAEDFMDDEDLGEFGISRRKIRTKVDFADGGLLTTTKDTRKRLAWEHPGGSAGSVTVSSELESVVRPVEVPASLGVRLLKQMGWKEGKGIGALMSKRQLERHKVHEMKSRGIRAKFDEEGVKLFEEMAPDFAFAPENIPPVYFSSHEGTKGLGYRGLEASSALDQRKGFNAAALQKKKGGKGIRGQAFGVGVFEEDDEDIYTNFDMTQYDFELGQTKGPKDAPKSDYTFVMAEKRLNARKFYDAPKLPAGFRAVHKPVPLNVDEMPDLVRKMGEKLSVTERARFLGDRSASVMELLPDAERKKLENWNKKPKRKSRWDLQKVEPVEEERRIEEHPTRENKEEVVEEQHPDKVSPFAEDPLKEHRFHQYRLYLRRGLTFPQPIDMTELEWDREVEEFQKYLSRDERDLLPEVRQKQVPLAANLAFTAPLAEMLKSRFTSATHEDANSSKKRSKDSDRLAAVKSKMFGPLTRQQFEWYPVKNLCKLFNVPDPYPYSSVQGVMHLQKRPAAATARIEDIALLGVGLPNTQNELKSKEAHPPFVKQERRKSEKEKALEDEDDIFSDDDFEDDESDVEDDTESGLVAGPSLNLLQAIFGASDDEIEEEEPLSGGQTRPEKRLESLFDDDEPRDSRPSPKPSVKAAVSEPSKKKFVSVLEMRELDEEFGPLPPPNLVPEPESEEDETRKSSKKHKKEKKHKKHKKNKKESKEKKEKKHKKEKKRRRSRSTSNSYESQ